MHIGLAQIGLSGLKSYGNEIGNRVRSWRSYGWIWSKHFVYAEILKGLIKQILLDRNGEQWNCGILVFIHKFFAIWFFTTWLG